jgi:capsular exopolysaccharide synthesis family protein
MSDSGTPEPYASWLERVRKRADGKESASRCQSEGGFGVSDEAEHALQGSGVADGPFIVALDDPMSPAAEQYRVLAARLEGLWKQPDFQKVAITSALPGEGKSLTTINVACVLAKDFGRRVLVIDGDFRRPSLWRFLGDTPSAGLSDLVADRRPPESVVRRFRHRNLDVLQTGQTPVNPTRLWKSQVMRSFLAEVGRRYDYILVDTPPAVTVVDAQLISELMDGVVVVVRSGATPKAMLQKALAALPRAKLVGTVFNGVRILASHYYHYHVRP